GVPTFQAQRGGRSSMWKVRVRAAIAVVGCAVVGYVFALPAFAQPQNDWPTRPVTIVVPGAPGGGGDFVARLLAEDLGPALGKPVAVETRAAAAGNIATTYVARAQPDGYTLLLAYSGTHVGNPALFSNLQWDLIKSFAPVALLVTSPQVIVVAKQVPANTLG